MVYGLGFRAKGPLVTRNHEYALEPRISSPRIYVRHLVATKEGRQKVSFDLQPFVLYASTFQAVPDLYDVLTRVLGARHLYLCF